MLLRVTGRATPGPGEPWGLNSASEPRLRLAERTRRLACRLAGMKASLTSLVCVIRPLTGGTYAGIPLPDGQDYPIGPSRFDPLGSKLGSARLALNRSEFTTDIHDHRSYRTCPNHLALAFL